MGKFGSATGNRYVQLPIFSVPLAKPAPLLALTSTAQNHFTSIKLGNFNPQNRPFSVGDSRRESLPVGRSPL